MSRSFGRFDLHAKAIEGSQKQSLVGAAITIVSALVMLSLFCTELQFYTTTSIKNRLYVDVARGKNQIRVNLNLSFPELACDAVHLDVEDAKGQKTLNADRMGTLHKHPLFGGERHLAETLVRTAADAALLKAQAAERVRDGKKRAVGSGVGSGSGSEDGAGGGAADDPEAGRREEPRPGTAPAPEVLAAAFGGMLYHVISSDNDTDTYKMGLSAREPVLSTSPPGSEAGGKLRAPSSHLAEAILRATWIGTARSQSCMSLFGGGDGDAVV